jgi:hypothetical protein
MQDESLIVNKQFVARSQMETAIFLWFVGYDPISIHTLAAASQTILHNLGSKVGKPSMIKEWTKTKSKAFQKQMTEAQNFFKHASSDPKQSLKYPIVLGEIHILDALMCYQNLFRSLTPLMKLFALRFSIEHPNLLPLKELTAKVIKGIVVEDVAGKNRRVFFDTVFPRLSGAS